MEIGDLVRLSRKGEKVSAYVDILHMARYGMVIKKHGYFGCWVRWFKHDGTPLLRTVIHRRDLKKLNKTNITNV